MAVGFITRHRIHFAEDLLQAVGHVVRQRRREYCADVLRQVFDAAGTREDHVCAGFVRQNRYAASTSDLTSGRTCTNASGSRRSTARASTVPAAISRFTLHRANVARIRQRAPYRKHDQRADIVFACQWKYYVARRRIDQVVAHHDHVEVIVGQRPREHRMARVDAESFGNADEPTLPASCARTSSGNSTSTQWSY